MASRIRREHERNVESSSLLQLNIADFSGNAFATAQIEVLRTELVNIGDFTEEQIISDSNARQNYEIAQELNQELKEAMRDVADFAVTMGGEIEGIEEKFRVTRTGGKRGRIARARVFATEAVSHKSEFIARGLESDFIENLNTKAEALEQALATATTKTASRVGAVESKMQSHKNANNAVALLDPIVKKRYRDNPAKLAAWISVNRVQRDNKPKPPTT